MIRPSCPDRRARAVVVSLVAVVLAAWVSPGAGAAVASSPRVAVGVTLSSTFARSSMPSGVAAAGALECSPSVGRLAVVVTVANAEGAPPTSRCAVIPARSSGLDALRAAGFKLRIESGFLCAIDGLPVSGCATGSGFDGTYWRYFRAVPGGSWSYSNMGAGYPIDASGGCAMEGWVWSGANARTPPAISPSDVVCSNPPVPTSTAPTTTASTPSVATPSPEQTAPGVATGPGSGSNPSVQDQAHRGSTSGTGDRGGSPAKADPVPTVPTTSQTPDGDVPGDGGTQESSSVTEPDQSPTSNADRTVAVGSASGLSGDPGSQKVATSAGSDTDSFGPVVGTVIALSIAAAFAIAAFVVGRRRRASSES